MGCECHAHYIASHAWIEDKPDNTDGEYLLNYIDPESRQQLIKSFDSEYEAEEFIADGTIKSYKLYKSIKESESESDPESESIDAWISRKNHYEVYFFLNEMSSSGYQPKVGDTIYLCDMLDTIYETRAEAEDRKAQLERADKYRHDVFEVVIEDQRPT